MLKVAKHSAEEGKCYMFNLSAPFLMQVPPFKTAMMEVPRACCSTANPRR